MKKDNLTNEFLNSSDWDEIVSLNGNYTLGLGYCYVNVLIDLFKDNNINYHYFDVKWGRCGTTYLFSALRPDNIIVLTAWQNSSVICGKTDTLFRIWKEILVNLSSINVEMIIFDFPAAWDKSNFVNKAGWDFASKKIEERKNLYQEQVIKPCLNNKISYFDLSKSIDKNSILLSENFNRSDPCDSPWHLTFPTINTIGKYFIDKVIFKNDANLEKYIADIKSKELKRYEKKYNSSYEM